MCSSVFISVHPFLMLYPPFSTLFNPFSMVKTTICCSTAPRQRLRQQFVEVLQQLLALLQAALTALQTCAANQLESWLPGEFCCYVWYVNKNHINDHKCIDMLNMKITTCPKETRCGVVEYQNFLNWSRHTLQWTYKEAMERNDRSRPSSWASYSRKRARSAPSLIAEKVSGLKLEGNP